MSDSEIHRWSHWGLWTALRLSTLPLYDKDEMEDLSCDEKKALKGMLQAELEARR